VLMFNRLSPQYIPHIWPSQDWVKRRTYATDRTCGVIILRRSFVGRSPLRAYPTGGHELALEMENQGTHDALQRVEPHKNPWASQSKRNKKKSPKTLQINLVICLLFSSWFCCFNQYHLLVIKYLLF
jgi:hypothetical protein